MSNDGASDLIDPTITAKVFVDFPWLKVTKDGVLKLKQSACEPQRGLVRGSEIKSYSADGPHA